MSNLEVNADEWEVKKLTSEGTIFTIFDVPPKATNSDPCIPLAAVRGIQAGREYYVVMCPIRALATLFQSSNDDLPPALRAQRSLNRSRIPQLARYVVENPSTYVFSSLAASVDAELRFDAIGTSGAAHSLGTLHIPLGSRFAINDGQHRLASLQEVLKKRPDYADETISIVLYADAGLTKSQQMFTDLNRYAVRPTRSLNILYDHRDSLARLARSLAAAVPIFKDMTVMESNSISNRERKLFTLNSIYHATEKLIGKHGREPVSKDEERLACSFWTEVGKHVPEWGDAACGNVSPYELRQTRIHAHGIALQAIATAGNSLLSQDPRNWKRRLAKLAGVDWARANPMWEGRALAGGVMCKAGNHVVLTSNIIKQTLGLPLNADERKIEESHEIGRSQQSAGGKQDNPHQRKARRTDQNGRDAVSGRRTALGHRV